MEKSFNVLLPEELIKDIKIISIKRDVTVKDYVRESLEEIIKTEKNKNPEV